MGDHIRFDCVHWEKRRVKVMRGPLKLPCVTTPGNCGLILIYECGSTRGMGRAVLYTDHVQAFLGISG